MNPTLSPGDQVQHDRFGAGRVEFDKGPTVLVRFEHGFEECEKSSLRQISTALQALENEQWHAPLEVITKAQAEAIESVNDAWGVFSRCRISLLPHQLWVCRRVLASWPARWLVADDVGLGKTIEAGLILWPLLSKGTVKRLLVVCPASLVGQWQLRLRTMFDIRLAQYTTDADTPRADFWGTHHQVVASLQTLRQNSKERHERFFSSDPWDLVIVDEAHHLNADEESGPTLGYKFVQRIVDERFVHSLVFFTGTPHRGKDYGFLSLMRLLRPDLFDVRRPLAEQLPNLSAAMIRNNKQNVTDLKGQRLFQPPSVANQTYGYGLAEAAFYSKLTAFITEGRAYASKLSSSNDGRAVMLVLIAMQKLASSSVAAIRRALKGRLARIVKARISLSNLQEEARRRVSEYEELERTGDGDAISVLEEQIAILAAELRLMENEEPRLQELVAAAESVSEETKINEILSIVQNQFADRQVLFFTEYKATQSLLMTKLIERIGDDCVGFINGDDRAEGVTNSRGQVVTLPSNRELTAERFNAGTLRFLVSTEAGGEGIDLQENCHSLIHVDLPWNPMRLHQRVGRLNRYGQTRQVEVIALRNPATVESRIWDKLNEKIERIKQALNQVMDEPEDLLQLVLGMTSPTLFREMFTEADEIPRQSLDSWFDKKTARFGGKDAIDAVRDLVGHCSRFDFQEVSSDLPRVDLPALKPFFISMLILSGRRPRDDEDGITFKTPDDWRDEPGIRANYESMVFERSAQGKNSDKRMMGVGQKVVDKALRRAKRSSACVATVSSDGFEQPIVIFRVRDRVTETEQRVRMTIVGVELQKDGSNKLVRDWELLERLNSLCNTHGLRGRSSSSRPAAINDVRAGIDRAMKWLHEHMDALKLEFRLPEAEVASVIWPESA